MTTSISRSPPLPALLAFAAAATFTAASAALNARYGWQKGGGDLVSSIIWCAVGIAASIGTAVSWSAMVLGLRRWQPVTTVTAMVALVLCGAYSMAAALGSASGARTDAHLSETTAVTKQQRAQLAYEAARRELEGLLPARPATELEPLIATKRAALRGANCARWVPSTTTRALCVELADFQAEAARALRRDQLSIELQNANQSLSMTSPPRQANADAAAIIAYLTAVGISFTAERINLALALLAVAIVELGGGLFAAVGTVLLASGRNASAPDLSRGPPAPQLAAPAGAPQCPPVLQIAHAPAGVPHTSPIPGRPRKAHAGDDGPAGRSGGGRRNVLGELVRHVHDNGGAVETTSRGLAAALATSKGTLHRALSEGAAAGLIRMTPTAGGTMIAIVS